MSEGMEKVTGGLYGGKSGTVCNELAEIRSALRDVWRSGEIEGLYAGDGENDAQDNRDRSKKLFV